MIHRGLHETKARILVKQHATNMIFSSEFCSNGHLFDTTQKNLSLIQRRDTYRHVPELSKNCRMPLCAPLLWCYFVVHRLQGGVPIPLISVDGGQGVDDVGLGRAG
jgi:hypothetical protein